MRSKLFSTLLVVFLFTTGSNGQIYIYQNTLLSTPGTFIGKYVDSSTTYGAGGYAIGKQNPYAGTTSAVYRSYFEYSLLDIPTNATIDTVFVNYSTGSFGYTFKITKMTTVTLNDPQANWTAIGNSSTAHSGLTYGMNNFISSNLKTELQNALASRKLILGALSENETADNSYSSLSLSLTVYYKRPAENLSFVARNDLEGGDGGFIGIGVGQSPTALPSPKFFDASETQTINLTAYDTNNVSGYRWVYNDIEATLNKSKWEMIKDNVVIRTDSTQSISRVANKNDNTSTFKAYLKKNFKIDKLYTTEFDGIKTNPATWIINQNSKQISAPADTTINGRTYKFAGWTDGNGDNQRTIWPDNNQTYTALYKIPQRSNYNVYANNSQRKIVRSDDGKLHMTYESMGYVWYERSANGGTTWQIMNGGKPIDSNPGKAPSIEVLYQPENYQSEIYIVYQTYTSSADDVAAIKVAYFLATQLQYINTVYVDDYYYRDYTSVNFNPVVAKMLAGRIMVAWEDYNIYYKIGNQISGGFSWGSTTSADNASDEKKFPTIASYRANPNGMFHLAWQNSYSTINYRSFTLQSNGTFIASSVENVSQGCGYPTNYAPSINVSSSNQVSLVWIGTPYYGSTTRKTISRTRTTSWSSSFGQYGDKVLSPNSAFYNGGNIIAWSENPSGSTYTNKFLKYGSVKTAGTTGRDIQVFNANQLDQMFISSFNSNAIPYYFSQSANLNSINKENGTAMASGVQAVAIGGKTDFYFRVGDVSVNGAAIDFIEFKPQYGTLSLNQLNNALLTNPFVLDGNSNINFSVEYGVTDSVSALNQLSNNKFITLKLELIDYLTKEVLKEVGKFTLDKKSLMTLLSNSYSYSISGLNGRQLSIRIKIVHNLNPLYACASIKSDAAVLPKANLINLTSLASELVTTYGLEQNYPNPFNPTTKINWQTPISGHQVLKVFDMLGNEVVTLVDEWRDGGKYSHEFNATNLPSGVYVYQLRVNDFTASKKLLLLK